MAEEHLSRAPRRSESSRAAALAAHYTVRMPHPASHNFEVEIALSGLHGDVTLAFPAWTPGSYKVRDFAKNVSAFKARDGRGDLEVEILDKQRFRIHGARDCATVTFTLYADEFSVRTPHLDDLHGFFLGTNLLPYIEREEGLPQAARYVVTIEPPKGWQVATGLPPVKGAKNTWFAADYDILGDSIFEIGTHEVHSFKAFGVKHDVAYVAGATVTKRRSRLISRSCARLSPSSLAACPTITTCS